MGACVVLMNHNGAGACRARSRRSRGTRRAPASRGSWSTPGSPTRWRVDRLAERRTISFEERGLLRRLQSRRRGGAGAAGRVRELRRPGRGGLGPPLRKLLEDPAVAVATGVLLRPNGREVGRPGSEIAPNMARLRAQEGEPRSALAERPFGVAAASGALMMVSARSFSVSAATSRCSVRRGGRLLPAPGRVVSTPGRAAARRRARGRAGAVEPPPLLARAEPPGEHRPAPAAGSASPARWRPRRSTCSRSGRSAGATRRARWPAAGRGARGHAARAVRPRSPEEDGDRLPGPVAAPRHRAAARLGRSEDDRLRSLRRWS